MTTRPRNITTCFVISYILTASLCAMILYDTADAQVDSNTLESIVKQPRSLSESAQIGVDGSPRYIFGDFSSPDTKGESENGTVTAIDLRTSNVENIPIGIDPTSIFGDLSTSDFIYITNNGPESEYVESLNGSISVINTDNNTVIKNIPEFLSNKGELEKILEKIGLGKQQLDSILEISRLPE